jgi:lipopolysaccharide transport system permease protein
MGARYHNPELTLDAERRALRVRFRLENRSEETWQNADGLCLGWQLFDPETGLFISEGQWSSLGDDMIPGASRNCDLTMELPPERGRYHIYISPRQETPGWFYEAGFPFFLIDVEVASGRARLAGTAVTTTRALRRGRLLQSLGRAFTYPALSVWRNRGLVRSMVRRDITARYRGSFGDVFWTVLNPLLLMLTYFFVFGIVLRARFAGDPSRSGFALYFLAGMLPWLPFSEAVGRSPGVILEHRNFVKKLVFPVEILPVNLVIAGLVTEIFALVVFLFLLLPTHGSVPPSVFWLPLLVAPQLLFTLGTCWFLAALGAYVRDLGQIIGFVMTLWFFITPICYPEESLPAAALPILSKNPIFVLVRGYRNIFLETQPPAFGPLWKLWLLSAGVCVLGYAWFHKLRKNFPDVI